MDARTPGDCHSLKGYSRLVDHVGLTKGKELVMLSKLLTTEEALNLGVGAEIVPADQLAIRVDEVGEHVTQRAPLTLAVTKVSMRRIQATRAPHRVEGEDLILSCSMSDDFRSE